MTATLSRDIPMVFDADALNLIASNPSIGAAFRAKTAGIPPRALVSSSPHPGEAARLLDVRNADIRNRPHRCCPQNRRHLQRHRRVEGSGTVIAAGRPLHHQPTGNPGMASGGMGDALAGMLVLSSRKGLPLSTQPHSPCTCTVRRRTRVEHGMAPHGLTASEVIFEARTLLNAKVGRSPRLGGERAISPNAKRRERKRCGKGGPAPPQRPTSARSNRPTTSAE